MMSLVGVTSLMSCETDSSKKARAYRIAARHQLIGGPRALGEIGDFMLENDQIRVVVQDKGFSRGFGVFGGGIIDADLVRTGSYSGDSSEAVGYDNFGEMFPAFFLEAMEPISLEIEVEESEEAAVIRVEAWG